MPMINNPKKPHNGLLNALPGIEVERLTPFLEKVELPLGTVLHEHGMKLSHAYFLETGIVSLMYFLEDGATAEIAVVGNEGLIGVALPMGRDSISHSAVVQSAGYSYRLRAPIFQQDCSSNGTILALLLRYIQSLITQMAQTAVCYRHHSLDQQLCRWLLLRHDRLPNDELTMSQESIATLLGVRRESVTLAAGKLQSAGLIAYHRGHITVLDRRGLEARACECYEVIKSESDRLLGTSNNPRSSLSAAARR